MSGIHRKALANAFINPLLQFFVEGIGNQHKGLWEALESEAQAQVVK